MRSGVLKERKGKHGKAPTVHAARSANPLLYKMAHPYNMKTTALRGWVPQEPFSKAHALTSADNICARCMQIIYRCRYTR